MKVGSLFSGIGGLDLGLERAGMRVIWQAESDPYCRAVLRKHWPDVPCYEDVRGVTGDAPAVDLICGGFPCQPVSKAGRRRAQDDNRWLWPQMARIIGDLRPRYVLVENVPGLLTAVGGDAMAEVLGDLAGLGFDADWESLPAASVGAPHLRDRVFIIAYPHPHRFGLDEEGRAPSILHPGEPEPRGKPRELCGAMADASGQQSEQPQGDGAQRAPLGRGARAGGGAQSRPVAEGSGSAGRTDSDGVSLLADPARERLNGSGPAGSAGRRELADGGWWEVEPDVGRVADGVPSRVDRLRALGNAVVPQVAEWIGRRLMAAEHKSSTPEGS